MTMFEVEEEVVEEGVEVMKVIIVSSTQLYSLSLENISYLQTHQQQ